MTSATVVNPAFILMKPSWRSVTIPFPIACFLKRLASAFVIVKRRISSSININS
jgi:hypothetical protein